jgi:hypothetical protein
MTDSIEKKANDAWEFLIEEARKRTTPLPGEKTVKQFVEETGMKYKTASNLLNSLVEKGQYSKREVVIRGRVTNYYKPVITDDAK